jgi:uncharacterized protein (TIGR00369 family)
MTTDSGSVTVPPRKAETTQKRGSTGAIQVLGGKSPTARRYAAASTRKTSLSRQVAQGVKTSEQGHGPAHFFYSDGIDIAGVEAMPPIEPLPFAKLMGVSVVSVTPDLVIGELKVREDLCTRPNVLHGGAYMAFADTIGAVATVATLKEGESTTTIESKTNFFAAIPLGDTARAECAPLHKGRSTMVWQTKITRGDGRLAAVVTQTQMVLKART